MCGDHFTLFFALFPDRATAAEIRSLALARKKALGLKGRLFAASRFHVSLWSLGSGYAAKPDAVIEAALRAGRMIRTAPFPVSFTRAETYKGLPGRHPFVLSGGVFEELTAFRTALGAALKQNGLARFVSTAAFTPHMTLFYADRLLDEDYPVAPPLKWEAKTFSLVWSHYGKTHYETLGEWPLGTG